MRHIILILFAAIGMTAVADDYKYLEVQHTSGAVSDIEMGTLRRVTFTGTHMVVTCTDGQQRMFDLAGLHKLFFSAVATPVNAAKAATPDSRTEVYDLSGRRLVGADKNHLQRGVYLIKEADGKTTKTAVQ